jgi:hypothetical protein
MTRLVPASFVVLTFVVTVATAQEPVANPYYPLKVGKQWTYRVGKESVVIRVDKEIPLEFTRDEKGEKKDKAIGYILTVTSGPREVQEQVAVLNDGVFKASTAGKALKPALLILKNPIKPGESWPVEFKTDEGKTIRGKFVTGTESVPLVLNGKEVKVNTVTVTGKDLQLDEGEMSIKFWFVENIGLVKEHVQVGKHETTLELRGYK